MSTIRQRLGNVIAWVGFAAFTCGALPLAVVTGGQVWETAIQEQPKITVAECNWVTPSLVVEDLFPDEDSESPSQMTVSEKEHQRRKLVGQPRPYGL
jgi:hypothetical protein